MSDVSILRTPYPYKAILAICSDLDETPSREVYEVSQRFLNTTQPTPMGNGLGLEVGNTLYFNMPPDQFSYWNADAAGREYLRRLVQSGHIDCLHSFGDLATTRAHAERALGELERHGCRIKVWIDHGTAITNFGADIMLGQGDVAGSSAYHSDITVAHGVTYVWRGRVTSIVGQDVRRRWSGVWSIRHPASSFRTMAKELAKVGLARRGSAKFHLHAENTLLQPVQLRDGQNVFEFMRCNPHWGGVSSCETADGIAEVLTDSFLSRLASRGGTCILYTHLGKVRDSREPFRAPTRAAFQRLADHYRRGEILVTTTRRALDFARWQSAAKVRAERKQGHMTVHVDNGAPDTDFSGLSLEVPAADNVELLLNGRAAQSVAIERLPSGSLCVSIPWKRLAYPEP